jgi:Xaa-Pro aminopeptidase
MSIYRERLRKVHQEMEERGIELLVLPPSPSMFYVTGIRDQAHFEFLKGPGDWLNGIFIGLEQAPVFVVNWEVHRILLRSSGIPTDVIA